MSFELYCGNCLEILPQLPENSVDLCFFSPPYEKARTYGIDFNLSDQAWVDWMVQVFTECRRVCKGLVACVCQGQTKKFRWSAVPALLMADLHRAGFHLRNPAIFHRVGIPGSGGPDWLRSDYEWIICTTKGGKLPWSHNTACGKTPKWAPGGQMSYRTLNGERVNAKPATKQACQRRASLNDQRTSESYKPPKRANPGNSIDQTYTASEVDSLLESHSDWRHHIVGGGSMGGDEYCKQNEAPFPESLAEFFVLSFCPPGGTILDPTCGSSTTGAVAIRNNRNYIGIDVRQSQIDLSRKRLELETPTFLTETVS